MRRSQRILRLGFLAGLMLGTAVAGAPSWAAGDDPDNDITATGSLSWVTASGAEVLGELGTHLPFRVAERWRLFLDLDTQTVLQKSIGDFTFAVDRLTYVTNLGADRRLDSGRRLFFFVGQRGVDLVDRDGSAFVRYVAGGTRSLADRGEGLWWTVGLGAVVEERNVSADAWLRGALAIDFASWKGFGIDFEIDGLFDGSSFDADVRVGPHYLWRFDNRNQYSVYLHYLRSRNPLGVGVDSGLVGFSITQLPGGEGSRLKPPNVSGNVAVGTGGGRTAGRLALLFSSPQFGGGWISVDVDANVLTGEDADNLFYFYHIGYERPVATFLVGAYFYHRSNHQLDDNPTVTSINVIDVGMETAGWSKLAIETETGGWGRLDGMVRLGGFLTSSFGETRSWHALGAMRWVGPWRWGPFRPLIGIEIEDGDVGRQVYSIGVEGVLGLGLDVQYVQDDQWFGIDDTAVLLMGRRRF
jgi:hypothetical protein